MVAADSRVQHNMYMGKGLADAYRRALELVNMAAVSRDTGRSWWTLMSYRRGERRATEAAAQEMVQYLRAQSAEFDAAADALATAIEKEAQDV